MIACTDIAARYTLSQIAKALNLDLEVATVAVLKSTPPDDWTADDQAAADDGRARMKIALGDAKDAVASAVSVRYDWPDVQDSPTVKRLIVDRAMYELYGDDVPDDIEARQKRYAAELEGLADGSRALLGADGMAIAERSRVLVHQGESTFTDDSLDPFLHPSSQAGSGPHRTRYL